MSNVVALPARPGIVTPADRAVARRWAAIVKRCRFHFVDGWAADQVRWPVVCRRDDGVEVIAVSNRSDDEPTHHITPERGGWLSYDYDDRKETLYRSLGAALEAICPSN